MNSKTKYFTLSLKKRFLGADQNCPCCGYEYSVTIEKKFCITSLQRCRRCLLLFRSPTTTPTENESFYQNEYTQGFTTDIPSDDVLKKLISSGFQNSPQNYSRHISVIKQFLPNNGRLFDFGCSWGYGSFQFAESGFEVEAYEISEPRRNYAEKKLGLKVHPTLPKAEGSFDVFFSAHVLEHVPSVLSAMEYGMSMLKVGGYFVAYTPNGSECYRRRNSWEWSRLWGKVHPNFLDDSFYIYNSDSRGFYIGTEASDPTDILKWGKNTNQRMQGNLSGNELLYVTCKT